MAIRVLLADDQTIVREALATMLSLLPGVEATRAVRAMAPDARVIVLTTRCVPGAR